MANNTLNTVDELERELRGTGSEYTDVDFKQELRTANNRVDLAVGRKFVERVRIEFESKTDVTLAFGALESFDKVFNPSEDDIVDSSNYSVTTDTGTVSFDQSFVDDNFYDGLVLKFFYTPTPFKTLERLYAAQQIYESEVVVTADEVKDTLLQRINQRINSTVQRINSRNVVAVQAGDNANRGSQLPRRFGSNP